MHIRSREFPYFPVENPIKFIAESEDFFGRPHTFMELFLEYQLHSNPAFSHIVSEYLLLSDSLYSDQFSTLYFFFIETTLTIMFSTKF